jgi:xylitol oxidase
MALPDAGDRREEGTDPSRGGGGTRPTNWAGNVTFTADEIQRPRSLEEAAELVAGATRIRAVGSRHSFNDLADSAELLTLSHWPDQFDIDSSSRTVRVSSGSSYGRLATYLHEQRYALHNLGSLPHISVGGACATGTHGSGDANGVLGAAVVAIELITASGDMLTIGADDPRLAGSVVSLGALGVTTHLHLRVEDTYDVRQQILLDLPWSVFLDRFDEVTSSAYSVNVLGRWGTDTLELLWAKERTDRAAADMGTLFGILAAGEGSAVWADSQSGNITTLGEAGPWSQRLTHFRTDREPSMGGAEIQAEYFVDRRYAPDALRAVRALADRIDPVLIISEFRTMARDELWLSGAFERDSLAIAFTLRPDPAGVAAVLPAIEAALAPFEPRPHWGKVFAMKAAGIRGLYPRVPDFLRLQCELDPEGKFWNAYLTRTLGEEESGDGGI